MSKLCMPSQLLMFLGVGLMLFQGYKMFSESTSSEKEIPKIVFQFLFLIFFVIMLNSLCSSGFSSLAWILFLFAAIFSILTLVNPSSLNIIMATEPKGSDSKSKTKTKTKSKTKTKILSILEPIQKVLSFPKEENALEQKPKSKTQAKEEILPVLEVISQEKKNLSKEKEVLPFLQDLAQEKKIPTALKPKSLKNEKIPSKEKNKGYLNYFSSWLPKNVSTLSKEEQEEIEKIKKLAKQRKEEEKYKERKEFKRQKFESRLRALLKERKQDKSKVGTFDMFEGERVF